jgi:hypothetical protein
LATVNKRRLRAKKSTALDAMAMAYTRLNWVVM